MSIASRFDNTPSAFARWVWNVADAINNLLNRVYLPFWKETSGTVTLEAEWTFVLCDTSGGVCTPTLPTGIPKGRAIIIQDSGNAGANNITITRGGSDTNNGANTLVISTNYGRRTLYSDGAGKWYAA